MSDSHSLLVDELLEIIEKGREEIRAKLRQEHKEALERHWTEQREKEEKVVLSVFGSLTDKT